MYALSVKDRKNEKRKTRLFNILKIADRETLKQLFDTRITDIYKAYLISLKIGDKNNINTYSNLIFIIFKDNSIDSEETFITNILNKTKKN